MDQRDQPDALTPGAWGTLPPSAAQEPAPAAPDDGWLGIDEPVGRGADMAGAPEVEVPVDGAHVGDGSPEAVPAAATVEMPTPVRAPLLGETQVQEPQVPVTQAPQVRPPADVPPAGTGPGVAPGAAVPGGELGVPFGGPPVAAVVPPSYPTAAPQPAGGSAGSVPAGDVRDAAAPGGPGGMPPAGAPEGAPSPFSVPPVALGSPAGPAPWAQPPSPAGPVVDLPMAPAPGGQANLGGPAPGAAARHVGPGAVPEPVVGTMAPPQEAPDLPELKREPRRRSGQVSGNVAGRRAAARLLGTAAGLVLLPLVVLSCLLAAFGTAERAGSTAERIASTRALRDAVAPQITDTVLAVTGEDQRDVVRPLVEQVLAEQGSRQVARSVGEAAWQVTLGGRSTAEVDLTPVTGQVWEELTQTTGGVPPEVAQWQLGSKDLDLPLPSAEVLQALWWAMAAVFVAGTLAWAALWPEPVDRRLLRLGRRCLLQGLPLLVLTIVAGAVASAASGDQSPVHLLASSVLAPARTISVALCAVGTAGLVGWVAARQLRR